MIATASNHALSLTGICKRYGNFTAVDDFSLNVPTGEILGFLGRNGAGKTTTIRMIMSIIYPDAGSIEVLGHPRAIDVKDQIGYLPEERGLYPKMTVEQTLHYFGRLKGMTRPQIKEAIPRGLERVELSDWLKKPVEALSKGMQQKLQFVVTVLHEPQLVILDEPFSGLDVMNTEVLKNLMFDMKQAGATVIFSTHQIDQAQRLCDRLVVINRGRRLVEGRVDEVRARYASRVITLSGSGDFNSLRGLPGVGPGEFTDHSARFELAEDRDPQQFLQDVLARVQVTRFEVQQPSLSEIFVKMVSEDDRQQGDAA